MTEQRKSLSATLRLTSDIWFRERGRIQLYPASALRIVDHHLHASGIIPRSLSIESTTTHSTNGNKIHQSQPSPRLYEHDWYCCNQSISCLPMEAQHIWLCLESEWSTFSHLWVDSVGISSISIGNLITLDSHVLATCRRVFIRKDPISGRTVPFTQQERFRLEKECSMDATISEILSMNPTGETYKLPQIENFGSFIPNAIPTTKSCLLKVEIGPQHLNALGHAKTADCNFILEVAIQAMMICQLSITESSLSIQYFDGYGGGEARLGHELQCFVHEDRIVIVRRCIFDSSGTTDTTSASDNNAANNNHDKSSLVAAASKPKRNDSPKIMPSSPSNSTTASTVPATTRRVLGKPVLIAIAKSSSSSLKSGRGKRKKEQSNNNQKNEQ